MTMRDIQSQEQSPILENLKVLRHAIAKSPSISSNPDQLSQAASNVECRLVPETDFYIVGRNTKLRSILHPISQTLASKAEDFKSSISWLVKGKEGIRARDVHSPYVRGTHHTFTHLGTSPSNSRDLYGRTGSP